MKNKWIGILGVMVILAVLMLSYLLSSGESKDIKIGHIAPLTGSAAIWGDWENEGIELAVEEINMQGGIAGRRIIVIQEDDKADPKTAVSALHKLINVDKVEVVIGATLSSTTLACAPIAEREKVVLLSPSAQSPKISEAGDYIFRTFVSSTIEGKHLATLAGKFNIKTAAIMYLNNDYGLGLSNVIQPLLTEKGISVQAVERYDTDVKDFRAQIAKIKTIEPDAIFRLGYPTDMGTILLQIKELALNVKVIAPDSFEADEIIKTAGGAAEGVFYVYPIIPDSEVAMDIKERFRARYGKDMNIYNGMGYDAVKILAVVIERSIEQANRIDGELVKNALYELKDFPGVTGPITFDKNGDVLDRPMELRTVKNGKFEHYMN